jgi:FlaA1/EpsC-like NDP-sugar epimerase
VSRSELIDVAALGIDAVSIVVAGLLAGVIYGATSQASIATSVYFGAAIVVACCFTTLMRSRGLYEVSNLLALDRQLKWVLVFWSVSFAAMIALAFLMKASADLSRGAGIVFGILGFAMLACHRVAWRYGLSRAMARGAIGSRKVAVVSAGDWQSGSAQHLALKRSGMDVEAHFELPLDSSSAHRDVTLTEVVAKLRGSALEEIVLALPSGDLHHLDAIVERLRAVPLPVRLLPDATISRLALQPVRGLGPYALIDIKREPLNRGELGLKRVLDVTVALAGLAAFAPLLGCAMLAIKLDSPGPVLFGRRGAASTDVTSRS